MRVWLDWTTYSATDVWGSVYGGGSGSSDGDFDYDYSTSGNSYIVLLDQGIVKVRGWRGDSMSRMGPPRKGGWGVGASSERTGCDARSAGPSVVIMSEQG